MKASALGVASATALGLLFASAPASPAAPAGRYAVSGGVVKDNKTGLYWQQMPSPTPYSLAGATTYCAGNAAGLSGTNWRLPTIKELQTLVDDSVASPGPTIDATVFPGTPAAFFWSSTPYALTPSSYAWVVFFNDGSTSEGVVSSMLDVRCVR